MLDVTSYLHTLLPGAVRAAEYTIWRVSILNRELRCDWQIMMQWMLLKATWKEVNSCHRGIHGC